MNDCSIWLIILLIFSPVPCLAKTPTDKSEGLDNETCLSCHANTNDNTFVDAQQFKKSLHGSAACIDCHTDIKVLPHDSPIAKVNCGGCHEEQMKTFEHSIHGKAVKAQISGAPMCKDCHGTHDIQSSTSSTSKLFWQNIPQTCGQCHKTITKEFNHSIHGQAVIAGKREAPVCTNCHGEHSIEAGKEASSHTSMAHIPETCGQCHGAQHLVGKYQLSGFVVNTYMESYHGLSLQRGSLKAANCASCHGTHNILPSSNPESSVYSGNLVKTCGQCHAGIGQQVIKGKIHSGVQAGDKDRATKMVRSFYLILIALVTGIMLAHNGLDMLCKIKAHYRYMASLGKPIRMGPNERMQHMLLVGSFIALAYTGFALKFPHAWWAAPFMGALDWRGPSHRVAAGIFMILSVYHGWYMGFTPKGRWQLKALLPKRIDFIQFKETFAYYFGKRLEKPKPAFYGYVEKIEYWALVWGSVIMAVSGAVMLKKEWFLQYFPKWLLDAIIAVHFYEAILACMAIVVWHFYFVIFDPDVYPMKWTWLTGANAPSDDERETNPENKS